jgi:hypothetical protein
MFASILDFLSGFLRESEYVPKELPLLDEGVLCPVTSPPLREFQGHINDHDGSVDLTMYLEMNGLHVKIAYPNKSDDVNQRDIGSITFEVDECTTRIDPDFEFDDPYTLDRKTVTIYVGDDHLKTVLMECSHGGSCDCNFNFDIAALADYASIHGYNCEYIPLTIIPQTRGSLKRGSLTLSLPSTASSCEVNVGCNSSVCMA